MCLRASVILQAAKDSVGEAQREHRRAEEAEQRLRQAQADAAASSGLLEKAQQQLHAVEQQAESAAGT